MVIPIKIILEVIEDRAKNTVYDLFIGKSFVNLKEERMKFLMKKTQETKSLKTGKCKSNWNIFLWSNCVKKFL